MARTGIGIPVCLFLCYISIPEMEGNSVNVALNKTYSQISFHRDNRSVSHAANNNTGGTYNDSNCIHTKPDEPRNEKHWWQVDLGRVYPVYNITLWARNKDSGFFNERLYPSTITVDNQTCTTVTAPRTGREQSVTCTSVMYGQMVRLTLDRPGGMLNLCEFQIFVPSGVSKCPAGQWGSQCGQSCSDHCGEGPGKNFCYQDTGVCYDGCTGNLVGNFCDGCPDGRYGRLCSLPCAPVCAGCHQDTGHCRACAVDTNLRPPDCTGCDQGYYKSGQVCRPCSSNCTGGQCDPDTGQCTSSLDTGEDSSESANSLVGPVVGAIVGVGLVMTVSITAAICLRRRCEGSSNTDAEPPAVPPTSGRGPGPLPERPSSSNQEDTYTEIRDPYINEFLDATNNYDKLTPFPNDDANREPYMQITSRADDVKNHRNP